MPKRFWKALAIEILAVALAAATGFVYARFIDDHASLNLLLAVLTGFFAVSLLRTIIVGGTWRRILGIVLETMAFLAFFTGVDLRYLIWAAIFIFAGSITADIASRRSYENSIKFRFMPFARIRIGRAFTGLLLAALTLYLPQWQDAKALVPRETFGKFYAATASTAKTVTPSLELQVTVGEFARKLISDQLGRDSEFSKMAPYLQEEEIAQAAKLMLEEAERTLKVELRPEMQLEDAFYAYANNMAEGWRRSFGGAFEAFWLVAIFVLLRGIGIGVVWMALGVSFLVYEALSVLGFVAVIGETRTKEQVILI